MLREAILCREERILERPNIKLNDYHFFFSLKNREILMLICSSDNNWIYKVNNHLVGFTSQITGHKKRIIEDWIKNGNIEIRQVLTQFNQNIGKYDIRTNKNNPDILIFSNRTNYDDIFTEQFRDLILPGGSVNRITFPVFFFIALNRIINANIADLIKVSSYSKINTKYEEAIDFFGSKLRISLSNLSTHFIQARKRLSWRCCSERAIIFGDSCSSCHKNYPTTISNLIDHNNIYNEIRAFIMAQPHRELFDLDNLNNSKRKILKDLNDLNNIFNNVGLGENERDN